MKIQDLKTVYICPDHNEKYRARKVHMDILLTNLGFKDFTHHKSGSEAYPRCLSLATIEILNQYPDQPILILEDDIEFNGVDTFDLVEDADAIYFGTSRSGGHPTENKDQGRSMFQAYSDSQVRVLNMLSTHAILYCSAHYKAAVIKVLTDYTGYNDVAISRIQPSFKVLANKRPSFFQSAAFNTGLHEQIWTKFDIIKPTLHLIATNKYIAFLDEMLESVDKHFFPTTQRHVIIYTNMPHPTKYVGLYPTIIFHFIDIQHEVWPLVTLKRFHTFLKCDLELDYSFYCDVDAIFVKTLENELLKDTLYGTIHPGFKGGKGTVCSDPSSMSCIPVGENATYFCGGFFGGSQSKFMKISHELSHRIQSDLNNGVIATWHDESHLNWYFWKHSPDVLAFPFAIAEESNDRRTDTYIVFTDKARRGGHALFREDPLIVSKPKPRGLMITADGFRLANISI
jgi:hypothetical protein